MSQTGCRNDAKTFCRDDIRPPILAVLPVFGIQISRRIYQLAEKSVLSDYQVLTLLLPVLLYGAYLFLMKSYTIYYERVIVQFGGLLEFEKKTKLILHEKCGKNCDALL